MLTINDLTPGVWTMVEKLRPGDVFSNHAETRGRTMFLVCMSVKEGILKYKDAYPLNNGVIDVRESIHVALSPRTHFYVHANTLGKTCIFPKERT